MVVAFKAYISSDVSFAWMVVASSNCVAYVLYACDDYISVTRESMVACIGKTGHGVTPAGSFKCHICTNMAKPIPPMLSQVPTF